MQKFSDRSGSGLEAISSGHQGACSAMEGVAVAERMSQMRCEFSLPLSYAFSTVEGGCKATMSTSGRTPDMCRLSLSVNPSDMKPKARLVMYSTRYPHQDGQKHNWTSQGAIYIVLSFSAKFPDTWACASRMQDAS